MGMGLLDALDQASQGAYRAQQQHAPSSSAKRAVPATASTSSSAKAGPSRSKTPTSAASAKSHDKANLDVGADDGSSPLARWSLTDLQTEARKYGFRVSSHRAILISQIEAAHRAIAVKRQQQEQGTLPYSSQSGSSAIVIDDDDTIGAITLMSDDFNDTHGDIGDLTAGLIEEEEVRQGESGRPLAHYHETHARPYNEGQRSYDTNADGDSDVGDEEGDDRAEVDSDAEQDTTPPEPSMGRVPAHVAKQLHDALLADADLYKRILLFEPVPFDEVSSTMKRAGVTGLRNKDTLRNWLDVQCICFYTSDLSGQRQRY